MAKNQIEDDGIPEDSLPSYKDFPGALKHVYRIALGDFDTDEYSLGDGNNEIVLWILFLFSSLLLCIHLLNMLIAIMGESFAANNEVKDIQ